ncbi:unnamed protein product [Toxocara canis]|uniref:GLOBIN domain-containing protein n=1 Tax=Toxocara canis TaxID=6265 RepID=A0A183V475_TOXCA|nr:unnamed protein product [Toxocara canis]
MAGNLGKDFLEKTPHFIAPTLKKMHSSVSIEKPCTKIMNALLGQHWMHVISEMIVQVEVTSMRCRCSLMCARWGDELLSSAH